MAIACLADAYDFEEKQTALGRSCKVFNLVSICHTFAVQARLSCLYLYNNQVEFSVKFQMGFK